MQSLQQFIVSVTIFIGNVLIPFLFGLALLVFLWNAFRFFILGAHEIEARDNARRLALYGILGFVFLVSIWGIINLLVGGLGIGSENAVTSDYIEANRPGFSVWFLDFGGDERPDFSSPGASPNVSGGFDSESGNWAVGPQ